MANTNQERHNILRLKKVQERTGLSKSTIYLRIQEDSFPKPINLGARAVGWVEAEIEAWLESRIEYRDNRVEINRKVMIEKAIPAGSISTKHRYDKLGVEK